MIIKKFTGKTEEEATEAARKELGNGLVIMNARTIHKKGLSRLLRPGTVEVTAALEDDRASLRSANREQNEGAHAEAKVTSPGAEKLVKDMKETKNVVNAMNESSQNIEKKLDSLETFLVSRLKEADAEQEKQMTSEDMSPEREEKKEPEERKPSEQERFLRLLYNTMLDNEVDEKYANRIVDDAGKTDKPNLPIDYILGDVYQKMILKFGRADGIVPADKGPRVVIFMGPTGVGKTTTIAKLASHFSMNEQKKIALLTADTYRIAAAEQLKTYANILEVPFRVVYTEEEAKEAVFDFKEFDYIFIDTAGHSHQNTELLDKLKKLLKTVSKNAEYQCFLVLSAATKYRDLVEISSNYRKVNDFQLIFTKLDETTTLGNLLNLKLYTERPIAYVTYGQNVPDDIECFNPQKTVKHILSTEHK